MNIKPLIHFAYGIATFVPGVKSLNLKGTGGTDSARYCYSVWLRHLVMAKRNGLNPDPKSIAELGPGDSLGIGLAALISGGEKYYAFDVVKYASVSKNLAIFDELVTLFRNKTPIPGMDEFPNVKPDIQDYNFPADILDDERLARALEPARLERIRNSVIDLNREDSVIEYRAPWFDSGLLERESLDTIYSQAVLEHVDDLSGTYKAMYLALKPNGYISHQVDLRSHGTSWEWNGHWAHSALVWRLFRGNQAYLINREPHSSHIKCVQTAGFDLVCDLQVKSASNLTPDRFIPQFQSISQDDLTTSGAFIQARK